MRVQIPAYTDMWMRGARYGEVVKVKTVPIKTRDAGTMEVAHVKLDLTGKIVRVVLADCTEV